MFPLVSNNIITEIEVILLGCDESIKGINPLNGYQINDIKIEEFSHKNDLIDGNGQFLPEYDPRINQSITDKFIYLYKKFEAPLSVDFQAGKVYKIPFDGLNDDLDAIIESERKRLYQLINLLRVFKTGNIGFVYTFVTQTYIFGVNNTRNFKGINKNWNLTNQSVYHLDKNEISSCDDFIHRYWGQEYTIMENIVNQFVFATDQLGKEICFEKLISTLEVMLLKNSERYKKEILSKRVAVLLGQTDSDIKTIYDAMKEYYKYRSKSTHEGDSSNINDRNLGELESITRNVLKKFFEVCHIECGINPNLTWKELKSKEISILTSIVNSKQHIF